RRALGGLCRGQRLFRGGPGAGARGGARGGGRRRAAAGPGGGGPGAAAAGPGGRGGGAPATRGRGGRCRSRLAGALVLALAAMPAAPGRTAPVEPLQHAPSRAGEWGFEAAATVIPFGRRLPVPDGPGGQTTQTHLEYGAGLSVAASYTVTDAWTVSLSAAADGTAVRGGPSADWRWEGGPLRAGLGAQWRLGGCGPLRHRLALDA